MSAPLESIKYSQSHHKRETLLSGIKAESITAWMSKGAVMSNTVRTLLKKAQ